MIRRRPHRFPFATGALALLLLSAAPARAEWVGRYFLFDRAVWSPDGSSVGIIGRYVNTKSGESLEDTLVVDAATGGYRCVSPSATDFVLSRDGSRILSMGRWGLYDYEISSGRTREVRPLDAFSTREIQLFSYNRTMDAAICIRCSDDYPESSGVHEFPLDGGPGTVLLPDPACGPQSLNYWQTHRRDIGPTEYNLPRIDGPTMPVNFPGTIWQLLNGRVAEIAVWGNGEAPADTLCRNCRAEFNSWPKNGGVVLLSTAPEDINDVLTPGDLWLLKPSAPVIHLARGRFEKAAWRDSTVAYALARPGRLFRIDVPEAIVTPVVQSLVPEWLSHAVLPSRPIWTVRLEGETYADPDSARTRALRFREFDVRGYGVETVPGGAGYRLSVGVFGDSLAAAAAGSRLRKEKAAGVSGPVTIRSCPVSDMRGQFDFGSLKSPDGRRRVYFRTHPHLFQPYVASEVWIQDLPEGRPRLAVRAMANF